MAANPRDSTPAQKTPLTRAEAQALILARTAAKPQRRASPEWREQVRAGLSGAVDEGTFGGADHVLALAEALKARSLAEAKVRYEASMARKRGADAYDDAHYGAARNAGRGKALAAQIALTGVPGISRAVATRVLPRVGGAMTAGSLRGLNTRGLTTLAAIGGLKAGLIDQAMVDQITGHNSTVADYAGATAGGILGGVTTRFAGPVAGGAVGGATTSLVHDLASGRAPSVGDAIGAAHAAATLGGTAGAAGTVKTSRLPIRAKGQLGEGMTKARLRAAGEKIIGPKKGGHRVTADGMDGYSVPDFHVDVGGRRGYVEAKMGPTAELSKRQNQLKGLLDPELFQVDGWTYRHAGNAIGGAVSPVGGSAFEARSRQDRRRQR